MDRGLDELVLVFRMVGSSRLVQHPQDPTQVSRKVPGSSESIMKEESVSVRVSKNGLWKHLETGQLFLTYDNNIAWFPSYNLHHHKVMDKIACLTKSSSRVVKRHSSWRMAYPKSCWKKSLFLM
jgi:hypothetical protein